MIKGNKGVKMFWLAVILGLAFIVPSANALADDHRGGRGNDGGRGQGWNRGRDGGHGREVVVVGHDRYHYRDGRFYRPNWFGFEFVVNIPPVGAVVTTLPYGHRSMVVGGLPYYYYDGIYYRSYQSRYLVVPEPTVVVVPAAPVYQQVSAETITINVPNSNGSFTPVTLIRRNGGYVGPQGEFYPSNPTVEQLRALYGR